MRRASTGLLMVLALAAGARADLPRLPATELLVRDAAAARATLGAAPGWDMPVPPLAAPALPAEALGVDRPELRAVLTQLAVTAGANDHLLLLQAQAAPGALVLRQGTAGLSDLAAAAPEALRPDGQGGWLLTRPLVVWNGARLQLVPEDRLTLSRGEGAFLLVFGQFLAEGAQISGSTEANPRSADFRPFLLAAGAAELRLKGTTLADLGMDRPGLFGGLTVLSSGLYPAPTPVAIADSRFLRLPQVSLRQADGAQILGNHWQESALQILGGQHVLLKDNLLQDSRGGVALRLSEALRNSVIQDTTILRPEGTALTISGLARRLVLGGTLIDRPGGDGISAERARCLRLEGLSVTRGGAAGLRLRSSGEVAVGHGLFMANGASAVAVEAQPQAAPIRLAAMTISGNGAGLHGWGAAEIDLQDMRLAGQAPRLFDGDLAPFTAAYLTATEGQARRDFALRPAGPAPARLPNPARLPAPVAQALPAFLPPGALPWSGPCLSE